MTSATHSNEPELIYRDGVHPSKVVGKKVPPAPVYSQSTENGLTIERNISVRLRDGVCIWIDLYRPEGDKGQHDLPVLLGWSPYGKHNTSDRLPWPESGVSTGWISPYTAFEAPDPLFWCPQGYAVAYPDPRGSWYSEGELRHGGLGEAQDCYDLIEWLGTQPWCNGKVGMTGVSYLTAIQWQVAPLRPPHLAAINPWEGFSDWYREFAYHGGIPETAFLPRGCANLQWSTTRVEDTPANVRAHPLYDTYWRSKECDLESVEVPAYIVASWSDQGLHTRGTLEAYKRIPSRQKWLEVHGRKKWHYYYRPQSLQKQRQFFDHFLKQRDTLIATWPPVLLEIRERANVGEMRPESEWPLARTQFRKLYLNASNVTLTPEPPSTNARFAYDPLTPHGRAVFDYTFTEPAELTGHMKLRLWVEAVAADDMDLFVAVQKLDRQGNPVPFVFYALNENGPMALGWLRVSHRELDPARSRPEQPVHSHTHEHRLQPGEIVPVDIELWPSSTRFDTGEGLRVVIQGRDIVEQSAPNAPFARHENTRNRGTHVLHTGPQFDSHLLIPWIPTPTSPPATQPGNNGVTTQPPPHSGHSSAEAEVNTDASQPSPHNPSSRADSLREPPRPNSSAPGPHSPPFTEADYRRYIAAFNRSDFAEFSRYYAPDVEFQGRGGHFCGRDAVVDFYRQVHARVHEKIEIRQLVMGDRALVADLITELEALEDWPDFPTGPLTRGEIRRSQNFVWYDLAAGEFSRVRAAHYRRGTSLDAEPPQPNTSKPGAALTPQQFASYLKAFNQSDYATLVEYYAPEVTLVIAGKHRLVGRQAIVDFYRGVKAQTRRTIHLNRLITTPQAIAAELQSEFVALQDLPNFTTGPMKKGEHTFINTFVLYDVKDNQFTRIRSAEFRKIHRS
jgi:predicted acyl esterase/ketosteroid isomerase-like protein